MVNSLSSILTCSVDKGAEVRKVRIDFVFLHDNNFPALAAFAPSDCVYGLILSVSRLFSVQLVVVVYYCKQAASYSGIVSIKIFLSIKLIKIFLFSCSKVILIRFNLALRE